MSAALPSLVHPRVSVVIIGRNEGEDLERCFASVQAMHYPSASIEVIYVDSDSSDSSVALANSMGIRTVALSGGLATAARGRNAGWTLSDSPFILFLDGDTVLHPDFLLLALNSLVDQTIAGVWGNRRESMTDRSIYNSVFDIDWIAFSGWTPFFGGDALVRRSALTSVGGYNEYLIAGEEPEMCRRMRELGFRILHLDIPMTDHNLGIYRWQQYWRRSVRTGYAYAEVSAMYACTKDPFWLRESRKNLVRAPAWVVTPFVVFGLSCRLHSATPALAYLAIVSTALVRTAVNARAKTPSRRTLLAYGLHSHFQHVPIFVGQLRYRYSRWRHNEVKGIAYKGHF